jgi:hypothetical protein
VQNNGSKQAEKAQLDSDDELDALCRQIESTQAPGATCSSSAATAAAVASGAKPASHAAQRSALLAADPKHLRAEVWPAMQALLSCASVALGGRRQLRSLAVTTHTRTFISMHASNPLTHTHAHTLSHTHTHTAHLPYSRSPAL